MNHSVQPTFVILGLICKEVCCICSEYLHSSCAVSLMPYGWLERDVLVCVCVCVCVCVRVCFSLLYLILFCCQFCQFCACSNPRDVAVCRQLGLSYVLATGGSITTALTLNNMVKVNKGLLLHTFLSVSVSFFFQRLFHVFLLSVFIPFSCCLFLSVSVLFFLFVSVLYLFMLFHFCHLS